MTHEHDFELILAIVEAEMSPADQSAAEASLAACDVCRSDLALQREALTALASAQPVEMTALERARVRRVVASALDQPVPQATPGRSVPWFQRLVPAMAAAAALVVVVGVGSLLVGNSGSDFDAASEPTTAADLTSRAGADEETANMEGLLESDDMADATTTTMAPAAAADRLVENLGELSKRELENAAFRLTEEPADGATDAGGLPPSITFEADLLCVEAAATEGEITLVLRATVEGVEVEIYRIGSRVDVYARPDCSLFDSFE